MSENRRVIDRINKLIRLSSDTEFEGERINTALEVVRLMHEHNLTVVDGGAKVTTKPRVRLSRDQLAEWQMIIANSDGICDLCREPFFRGEAIFTMNKQFIHIDAPCDG